MTRIAILDPMLPNQIAERPSELQGIEVVWAGVDREDLTRRLPHVLPHIVVCSLPLLGRDAPEFLRKAEDCRSVELVVVLHDFARRSVRENLAGEKRRVVQAPVSVARLRSHIMSVLVRHMLGDTAPPPTLPRTPSSLLPPLPNRRFTPAQLGRLMEIASAVECECPNHLSQLVSGLLAFEAYSAQCESKNDADAAIHRMLHQETSRARAIMEEALARLVEHEGIAL